MSDCRTSSVRRSGAAGNGSYHAQAVAYRLLRAGGDGRGPVRDPSTIGVVGTKVQARTRSCREGEFGSQACYSVHDGEQPAKTTEQRMFAALVPS